MATGSSEMARPSFIRQPGPAQSPRVLAVEGRGRAFPMRLEAGLPLLEAVRQGFAAAGFASGTLRFGPLALSPFAYVIPALSRDGQNAATYSETFRPAGISRLECGALTFGRRDGGPFFHCHAIWREADGKRSGGHILPDETILAEDATASAFGIDGALFEANPDPETNFKLFGPVPALATAADGTRAFALRLRPNQCFHAALEGFCREQGLARAVIHGGVGSLIGSAFENGRVTEPFATEVCITRGLVEPDADGVLRAEIDAALVDFTGALAEGRLEYGANPVLMTFELILTEA
jgi:predicted DNA-binding protein with PD1-like motif